MNGFSSANYEGNPIHLALSAGRKDVWVRQAVWSFCTLQLCFPIHTQWGRHTSTYPSWQAWVRVFLGSYSSRWQKWLALWFGSRSLRQGKIKFNSIHLAFWAACWEFGSLCGPRAFQDPFIIFLTHETSYLWLASPTKSAMENGALSALFPCIRLLSTCLTSWQVVEHKTCLNWIDRSVWR